MPIKIAKQNDKEDKKEKEIAWLCDDSWRLPEQLKEFEKWLQEHKDMPTGNYYADIGFSPRSDALGGGGVVSLESMDIMLSLGIELYFSEYPDAPDK